MMEKSPQLTLKELSQYFHLPISEVAKILNICCTVLKKICRQNGIPRWPHRKLKSIDKMIMSLQATTPKTPSDSERIQREIIGLKKKKQYLINNPGVLGKKRNRPTTLPVISPASGKTQPSLNTKVSKAPQLPVSDEECGQLLSDSEASLKQDDRNELLESDDCLMTPEQAAEVLSLFPLKHQELLAAVNEDSLKEAEKPEEHSDSSNFCLPPFNPQESTYSFKPQPMEPNPFR